jgi:hypothetical protein
MTTDPTKSLAPQPFPPAEKNALTEMLDSDLAQLSLRELLGMLLSSVGAGGTQGLPGTRRPR